MAEQIEIKINPLFEPLFNDNIDDPRYYQVYGGRASGKSFAVSCAMVQLTYSEHSHKILYLRQTMTTSDDSTVADVKNAILLMGVQDDFRENRGTITNLRTGGKITFKGIRSSGNNSAKLKSLSGITTVVFEEAEEIESFDEFSKIDESIRLKNKPLKVILVYNPTSAISSWIHQEWFKQGFPKTNRKDTVYIHSTYFDNLENLAASTIKQFERLKVENLTHYTNNILAEWTLEVDGQIYAAWDEKDRIPQEALLNGDTWYGLDFGYGGKDKTALIKICYFENWYYVEQLFSKSQLSLSETVRLIKLHCPTNGLIFADSAMPLLITEIRNGGHTRIRKASKGNVEAGIKKIQDKQICLIGGRETSIYESYMTFCRDRNNKLPHEPDELAAMRYGINSKRPAKNRDNNVVSKRSSTRRGGFM